MTSKIFTFQKLQVIVGEPDKVENRLPVAPVKTRWVDVAMHKVVVVHVGDCACDLSENKK